MEFREYFVPLLKWWWLLVAATLVATAASIVATRQQPSIYQTRTTLMVGRILENPNPNAAELGMAQQLAGIYSDAVQRQPVRQATMEALGLSWLPRYSVRLVPATPILEITVYDTSPERAQAVANELANQLIRQSPAGSEAERQQRLAFVAQQLDRLQTSITETEKEIAKQQAELEKLFSARQIANAQELIAALESKLNILRANYASLLAETQRTALNTLRVLEPARLPTVPVGPNRPFTVLVAAAIGFLLAAGTAYLLEYLDATVKSPDDIEKVLGLTTLGAIPLMKGIPSSSNEPIIAANGRFPPVEPYRLLRVNLEAAAANSPFRLLLVTSPSSTEGKSTTAINLAIAMAQAGQRTAILVDADLHRPKLHQAFDLPNQRGLTTALLNDDVPLENLLQRTKVPRLCILTSGPTPFSVGTLLDSARMQKLLADLQTHADTIIIDGPPVMTQADTITLARQVDGVLLVLDYGRTRRDVAQRARDSLHRANARVIGVLLNRVPTDDTTVY